MSGLLAVFKGNSEANRTFVRRIEANVVLTIPSARLAENRPAQDKHHPNPAAQAVAAYERSAALGSVRRGMVEIIY